jgi:predicted metal-dependent enzyme (double-stranded beta helix superfamily)
MVTSSSEALRDSIAAMSTIRSLTQRSGENALEEVAAVLQRLARSPHWRATSWRAATPSEELLYELAVLAGAPSLYLVSDGQGVTSPPHEHGTWTVIAGVSGNEANDLYRRVSGSRVAPINRVVVGPGESMVLTADAIHSTEVVGEGPTFHLHLYGRPLSELDGFASRVFAKHD